VWAWCSGASGRSSEELYGLFTARGEDDDDDLAPGLNPVGVDLCSPWAEGKRVMHEMHVLILKVPDTGRHYRCMV